MRNLAIIAHVDHGKTTMIDCLLKACSDTKIEERAMDSMALEKERGITIVSKVTSMNWKDTKLNICDTPGHADFGGEVERVMGMVDGIVLIVDATDGPNTQTKFVTKKALERGLRPIVVINKVDRDTARVTEVENEVFDLFCALDATDEQLEFPFIYASAKEGWAVEDVDGEERVNMSALLDKIIEHVPPPVDDPTPFKMIATMMGYDNFDGRLLMGRVQSGSLKVGEPFKSISLDGEVTDEGKVFKMYQPVGTDKIPIEEAKAGDIVQIAGLSKAGVSDTISAMEVTEALPSVAIDPPTLNMTFSVNSSPLQGKSGKKVSSQAIQDRLMKELETNVSITVQPEGEQSIVFGRGELQLGILIENMRREGYELSISPPQVVMKEEDGQKMEPIEEITIDVDENDAGKVLEKLASRKGEMLDMFNTDDGRTRMHWRITSRALLGYNSVFTLDTKGNGVMNRIFVGYEPYKGYMGNMRTSGVLISTEAGKTTSYALDQCEKRGMLFVGPQEEVYNGMIIGENNKDGDLEINPVRAKALTNIRASGTDETIRLTPPKKMSLEEAMGYIGEDELLEVTPDHIRLRKALLDPSERERENRKRKQKRDALKNKK